MNPMQALNYSAFFLCPAFSGSLQKDPNRGSENFCLRKTLCRNPNSERKRLIVGLGRGFLPDLRRTSVFRTDYLRANMGSPAFGFTSQAFRRGWSAFQRLSLLAHHGTKYDSTEMSQGPRSTQLSIKENWMEGDRGPDSHLCVKGSLKKASVAFETDLRKGRQ